MLGSFIWELFNGTKLSNKADIKKITNLPKALLPQYQAMFSSNPHKRPPPDQILTSSYFSQPYAASMQFATDIRIKDTTEKVYFLGRLSSQLSSFPDDVAKYKFLPAVLTTVDIGIDPLKIMEPLMKIAALLEDDEYEKYAIPPLVKWFNDPKDKVTRLALLPLLDDIAPRISTAVAERIFPGFSTCFTDPDPRNRELAVKASVALIEKLPDKMIDNTLLPFLSQLQTDQEPGLRTNTTLCLGKIAPALSEFTRKRILSSAFTRALRDPFPPARKAAIHSIQATLDYYDEKEKTGKLIPALGPLLIDPEEEVRVLAKSLLLRVVEVAAQPQASAGRTASAAKGGMLGWVFSKFAESPSSASSAASSSASSASAGPSSSAPPSVPSSLSAPSSSLSSGALVSQPSPAAHSPANDGWDDEEVLPEEEAEEEEPYHYPTYGSNNSGSSNSSHIAPPHSSPSTPKPAAKLPAAPRAMSLTPSSGKKANHGWDDLDDDEAWDFAKPSNATVKRK